MKSFLLKISQNKKGFSLLEMSIVIFIIVMITSIFFSNFRGFEQKALLETEADKIISIIKQAQIYALTGQTVSGTRYNFGLYFNTCTSGNCQYLLFYDANNNKNYDSGEAYGGITSNLLKGVYVNSVTPNTSGLNILFEAPYARVYFNGAETEETASLVLKHLTSANTKTITINRLSGQVKVE